MTARDAIRAGYDMRYGSSIAKIPALTKAVPLSALTVPAMAQQSATSGNLSAGKGSDSARPGTAFSVISNT